MLGLALKQNMNMTNVVSMESTAKCVNISAVLTQAWIVSDERRGMIQLSTCESGVRGETMCELHCGDEVRQSNHPFTPLFSIAVLSSGRPGKWR